MRKEAIILKIKKGFRDGLRRRKRKGKYYNQIIISKFIYKTNLKIFIKFRRLDCQLYIISISVVTCC